MWVCPWLVQEVSQIGVSHWEREKRAVDAVEQERAQRLVGGEVRCDEADRSQHEQAQNEPGPKRQPPKHLVPHAARHAGLWPAITRRAAASSVAPVFANTDAPCVLASLGASDPEPRQRHRAGHYLGSASSM